MAGKNQTYPDNRGAVPLCYESVNGSCPKFIYPVVIRVPLYIFFGTTVLLTVIGNLLVVITVVHFKQLRSPTNYLIVSLAMADLLVGAFLMPPSIVRSVENCWYLGNFYYRYYAICHPLRYQTTITPSVTMAMIFISWSVPGLVGFGMIFLELNILGYEEFYYNNFYCEGACILFQGGLSGALSSILSFYIPGVIMLSIYAKLYSIAQKQARSIQDKHNTNGTSASKMERKATRTLAIIMGVFLSLWLPFFICNIIDPFIGYSIPPLVFDMVMWIAYFNSTCNPIVYALFYSWFRKAFKMILFGKIFGQNSSSVNLFRE
ncbi:trace amine-associated receptor 1-like [Alosa alosa]|uniref:trace amine-associated receptor 1-like n=1 Tax=Alosa alosa TaxID=278164 RepID=UPI00201509AC|nr:trace amine-associated receptor 1-like [Alosa alosa]